eukprot:CAMPEP_0116997534 /NCGR_PEP_ID=MMETSP0472-20121206/940_1 /TAXON_ID=693140 ORGANISM="Tiarina fusus, Strain LIS" /NCGR_SAMPLE_ID=MMETSP0472 /ASSEMBLY_ACC=CAM_ASM_000603 /LENGTH=183 /DNA_ID=CAMNT_0004696451 /DNA_START=1256 /DNA_END=1807 /DNA_ORIENTATION=-
MINDSNNSQDAKDFGNKLNILKAAEKELKAKIALEQEKLALLKGGLSLAAAKEKILLRKQSDAPNCGLDEISPSKENPVNRNSRRERRKNNRRSTPADVYSDEIVKTLKLSDDTTKCVDDERARTAREFGEGDESRATVTARKKKSRSRSRSRSRKSSVNNGITTSSSLSSRRVLSDQAAGSL